MNSRKGSVFVEFAMLFSVLVLLVMAAGDFGRIFFDGIIVQNSASTGAHWGSISTGHAASISKVEARALQDTDTLADVLAIASQFCECPPNNPNDFTTPGTIVSCDLAGVEGTCTAGTYGYPRVYVKTRVETIFQTIGPYPGIPQNSEVSREAYMRVQ